MLRRPVRAKGDVQVAGHRVARHIGQDRILHQRPGSWAIVVHRDRELLRNRILVASVTVAVTLMGRLSFGSVPSGCCIACSWVKV